MSIYVYEADLRLMAMDPATHEPHVSRLIFGVTRLSGLG